MMEREGFSDQMTISDPIDCIKIINSHCDLV